MKRMGVFATLAMTLAVVAGCGGIQDSTQPPENSISAGPKSDAPPVKAKGAVHPGSNQKGR